MSGRLVQGLSSPDNIHVRYLHWSRYSELDGGAGFRAGELSTRPSFMFIRLVGSSAVDLLFQYQCPDWHSVSGFFASHRELSNVGSCGSLRPSVQEIMKGILCPSQWRLANKI